jgi:hypothetical protein
MISIHVPIHEQSLRARHKGNVFAGLFSVVSFLRVSSPGVGDSRSTGRFFDQVPDALASGDLERK